MVLAEHSLCVPFFFASIAQLRAFWHTLRMSRELKQAFAPVIGKNPRILILGSMPGEESLLHQQYYAHPRNAFWKIMATLYDFDPADHYERRLHSLQKHQIALWDVMAQCERQGSLDSQIVTHSIRVNDFVSLFSNHPSIQHLFFNGSKAEQEFKKRVIPQFKEGLSIGMTRLPSTSPAMAMLSYEEKLAHWRVILSV